MSFLNDLKLLGLQIILPLAVQKGEVSLHDYLKTLAAKKPRTFALLLQTLYPAFKGALQPLCQSTKTPLDDIAVDPTVEMLEGLMTELGIPIPVVVPIDFESEEDLPAPMVTPA